MAVRGRRGTKGPIQFNWRRHWSKKVAPHLKKEIVQECLDWGMTLYDREWKRGDPPFAMGAIPLRRTRIVPGKLTWYQPWCRCHWIAFFSMAIGVLNYPHLDWRFASGGRHTVPVGYGADGEPEVVMDILRFDAKTAEESIAATQEKVDPPDVVAAWDQTFRAFISEKVPVLRASATPSPDAGASSATKDPAARPTGNAGD